MENYKILFLVKFGQHTGSLARFFEQIKKFKLEVDGQWASAQTCYAK